MRVVWELGNAREIGDQMVSKLAVRELGNVERVVVWAGALERPGHNHGAALADLGVGLDDYGRREHGQRGAAALVSVSAP